MPASPRPVWGNAGSPGCCDCRVRTSSSRAQGQSTGRRWSAEWVREAGLARGQVGKAEEAADSDLAEMVGALVVATVAVQGAVAGDKVGLEARAECCSCRLRRPGTNDCPRRGTSSRRSSFQKLRPMSNPFRCAHNAGIHTYTQYLDSSRIPSAHSRNADGGRSGRHSSPRRDLDT